MESAVSLKSVYYSPAVIMKNTEPASITGMIFFVVFVNTVCI